MSSDYQKIPRVNIEQYIQSGIVESYALKLATSGEASEFEQLLPHYPLLKEALSDFEYHLELSCIDHEIPPPSDIKKKIEARLREMPVVRRGARMEEAGGGGARGRDRQGDYLSIDSSSSKVVSKHWKTMCIVFFLVGKLFLGFLIYYFIQYRLAQKQVIQLEEQLGKSESVRGVNP